MYLFSKDAGKNHTEISELLNGIHHSSIGKTIARVVNEIAEGKKTKQEVKKIESQYEEKSSD